MRTNTLKPSPICTEHGTEMRLIGAEFGNFIWGCKKCLERDLAAIFGRNGEYDSQSRKVNRIVMKKGSPIYTEYYPHDGCDCFKIDLPWSGYKKDTRVLCKVSDGYERARFMATGVMFKHFLGVV